MSKQKNQEEIGFQQKYCELKAEEFLSEHNIKNYKLKFQHGTPSVMLVDVEDDVDLSHQNLIDDDITNLHRIKFNIIRGNFNCSNNKLASLNFCPKCVVGDFNCSHNQLTSLKNAPEYVGKNFDCSYNNISDITNLPTQYIGGNFYAYGAGNTFEITDELRKIVKGDIYK